MFVESAELYDAIYHFKNYARECEILRAVISVAAPGARTVLDVACGTGEHDKFLKEHYAVAGIDINENYLHSARAKNSAVAGNGRTHRRRPVHSNAPESTQR